MCLGSLVSGNPSRTDNLPVVSMEPTKGPVVGKWRNVRFHSAQEATYDLHIWSVLLGLAKPRQGISDRNLRSRNSTRSVQLQEMVPSQ